MVEFRLLGGCRLLVLGCFQFQGDYQFLVLGGWKGDCQLPFPVFARVRLKVDYLLPFLAVVQVRLKVGSLAGLAWSKAVSLEHLASLKA